MHEPGSAIVWLTFATSLAPVLIAYLVAGRLRPAAIAAGDERFPGRLTLTAGLFLGGAGGALFGIFLGPPDSWSELARLGLWGPAAEELGKGLLPLGLFVVGRLRSRHAGLAAGLVVGAGFAAVENLFFSIQGYADGGADEWLTTVQIRLAFGTLIHMGASGVFGAALGDAWAQSRSTRYGAPLAALLGALLVHGGWNASLYAARTRPAWALMAILIAAFTLAVVVALLVDTARKLRSREGAKV